MSNSQDPLSPENLERYRAWLLVLARASVRPALLPRIDVEAVVQDTLLEAHQRAGDFEVRNNDVDGSVQAFLRTILGHKTQNEIRKHQRDRRDVDREREIRSFLSRSSRCLDSFIPATDTSPSGRVVRKETRRALCEAIERLADECRSVVALKFCSEWTFREIAEELALSQGAVLRRYHRGLREMRRDPILRDLFSA